jgi:hypothetical protein
MKIRRLLVAAFALVAACATNNVGQPSVDPGPTTVRVENRGFADMTVYVLRSSQRIRLGNATAHADTKFVVPAQLIFGATPLRFIADPIAGNRASVSEEITVSPGDAITLTIPPN